MIIQKLRGLTKSEAWATTSLWSSTLELADISHVYAIVEVAHLNSM